MSPPSLYIFVLFLIKLPPRHPSLEAGWFPYSVAEPHAPKGSLDVKSTIPPICVQSKTLLVLNNWLRMFVYVRVKMLYSLMFPSSSLSLLTTYLHCSQVLKMIGSHKKTFACLSVWSEIRPHELEKSQVVMVVISQRKLQKLESLLVISLSKLLQFIQQI